MRSLIPALATLSVLPLPSCSVTSRAPAEPPRLVVAISVDQLAQWLLDETRPVLARDGGFARFAEQGVTFSDCAFAHSCTETGPGHASLSTGASAAVHGIVGNTWWDRQSGGRLYCAADPEHGRGPALLEVPTLGDSLRAARPGAKVVALSIKDRSAVLMGGREADVAAWWDSTRGQLRSSGAYPELPAWLVAWNERRVADQWFGETWERVGPEAAYAGLEDDRPFEAPDPNGDRTFPHRLDGGGKDSPDRGYYGQLASTPFGNSILTSAALAAVRDGGLGADEVPDLLWLGLSSCDYMGHQYGPRSVEQRDQLLRLDAELAALFDFFDEHVGPDRWVALLSADHGVQAAPEAVGAVRDPRLPQRMVARGRQELREHFGEGRWISTVSGAGVYLDHEALAAAGHDLREAREVLAACLSEMPRVARVATADALEGGGLEEDPLRGALAAGYRSGRSGDVFVVFEEGLHATTTTATHGTPWPRDRQVPLLALGAGVPRGRRIAEPVEPGMMATLAAQLLQVEPPVGARRPVPAGALR